MQEPAVSCSLGLKPMLADSSVVGNGVPKEDDRFESATLFDLMDGQVELGYYHVRTLRALIKQVCNSQYILYHKLIKWNAECHMRVL